MLEPRCVVLSRFRLDGGAMFGAVPRVLWERQRKPDEEGRIDLVGRALLLSDGERTILVDAGVGDKFDESARARFCVVTAADSELPFQWAELTDIVPTHLHFDHGGGLTRWRDGDRNEAELVAPQARVFLQEANWEHAGAPGVRERGSYLRENVEPLKEARLELLNDSVEVVPGVRVRRSDGHTRGMQWLVVETTHGVVAFPSDLVPTASHLHLPWGMGYDMCAERLLEEKQAFLEEAVAGRWIVVFAHDPETPAGRVGVDARGRFVLSETVTWEE